MHPFDTEAKAVQVPAKPQVLIRICRSSVCPVSFQTQKEFVGCKVSELPRLRVPGAEQR